MQVTLNIDSENIGATVERVFASLSEDDKKDLARQVMAEALREPMGAERKAYERNVVEQLIEEYALDSYTPNRIRTPEEARASYKFKERMGKYVSSSDRMTAAITAAAVQCYVDSAKKMVEEDEQLQGLFKIMREQLVVDFPGLVQAAMIQHFVSQMGQVQSAISQNFSLQSQIQFMTESMNQRLSRAGVPP